MVALKTIPKDKIIDWSMSNRLINERDVLKHLTAVERLWDSDKNVWEEVHGRRFVMTIFSAFHDPKNVYLELEYIKGASLLG